MTDTVASSSKADRGDRNASPNVEEETASPEAGDVNRMFRQRQADALIRVAETCLQGGQQAARGGDRQQIVVHVDIETLRSGSAGRCQIQGGPALSAVTARRLCCDASMITLIEDEHGEPLNIGRKTRSIPPAIHRALRARGRCCRFPGCHHTLYLDGHHIHHWADDGETRFDSRQGPLMAAPPIQGNLRALLDQNKASGLRIDAKTSCIAWGANRQSATTPYLRRWLHKGQNRRTFPRERLKVQIWRAFSRECSKRQTRQAFPRELN